MVSGLPARFVAGISGAIVNGGVVHRGIDGERGCRTARRRRANIGLFGSSCRPSATAFCHTSPWPWLTA